MTEEISDEVINAAMLAFEPPFGSCDCDKCVERAVRSVLQAVNYGDLQRRIDRVTKKATEIIEARRIMWRSSGRSGANSVGRTRDAEMVLEALQASEEDE